MEKKEISVDDLHRLLEHWEYDYKDAFADLLRYVSGKSLTECDAVLCSWERKWNSK